LRRFSERLVFICDVPFWEEDDTSAPRRNEVFCAIEDGHLLLCRLPCVGITRQSVVACEVGKHVLAGQRLVELVHGHDDHLEGSTPAPRIPLRA
jgi:hypothetical protein